MAETQETGLIPLETIPEQPETMSTNKRGLDEIYWAFSMFAGNLLKYPRLMRNTVSVACVPETGVKPNTFVFKWR